MVVWSPRNLLNIFEYNLFNLFQNIPDGNATSPKWPAGTAIPPVGLLQYASIKLKGTSTGIDLCCGIYLVPIYSGAAFSRSLEQKHSHSPVLFAGSSCLSYTRRSKHVPKPLWQTMRSGSVDQNNGMVQWTPGHSINLRIPTGSPQWCTPNCSWATELQHTTFESNRFWAIEESQDSATNQLDLNIPSTWPLPLAGNGTSCGLKNVGEKKTRKVVAWRDGQNGPVAESHFEGFHTHFQANDGYNIK